MNSVQMLLLRFQGVYSLENGLKGVKVCYDKVGGAGWLVCGKNLVFIELGFLHGCVCVCVCVRVCIYNLIQFLALAPPLSSLSFSCGAIFLCLLTMTPLPLVSSESDEDGEEYSDLPDSILAHLYYTSSLNDTTESSVIPQKLGSYLPLLVQKCRVKLSAAILALLFVCVCVCVCVVVVN